MATFNKFNSWAEVMTESANIGTDQFAVFLTNVAPIAANTVIADITEATYTNLSSRAITTSSSSQTGGTQKLVFADLVLTSSGGTTGPFRYVGVYDDTLAGDPLVCWYDYGSSITLADTEFLTIDFSAANGFIQVT